MITIVSRVSEWFFIVFGVNQNNDEHNARVYLKTQYYMRSEKQRKKILKTITTGTAESIPSSVFFSVLHFFDVDGYFLQTTNIYHLSIITKSCTHFCLPVQQTTRSHVTFILRSK